MGHKQPIIDGAAALMALLAAPVLAQPPASTASPATGGIDAPPASPAGKAAPAAPFATPNPDGAAGSGSGARPARTVPAGSRSKNLVEPLILWQPEGAATPGVSPGLHPARSAIGGPGRPPAAGNRPPAGLRPANGLPLNGPMDPFAPMGSRGGINPLLPGMGPNGPGGSGRLDPRRLAGRPSPGGGSQGAGPRGMLMGPGQGPNGMPMDPGAGSPAGPQGRMPEGAAVPPPGAMPPGMIPPGAVPPGMIPPGAVPPGAGRPGPGAMSPAGMLPPGAMPPGLVRPGGSMPDAAPRPPSAGDRSASTWSPWPSLFATFGLGGAGLLLALLARRRSRSDEKAPAAASNDLPGQAQRPLRRVQSGDQSD